MTASSPSSSSGRDLPTVPAGAYSFSERVHRSARRACARQVVEGRMTPLDLKRVLAMLGLDSVTTR